MTLFWLCLILAFLLWLFYFLRVFWGTKYYLPSLIFIKEEEKLPIRLWQKILLLVLQTAFFLMAAAYFFEIRPKSENFVCLVDDFLRSHLSQNLWQYYQNLYEKDCQARFYSLASLSENHPQELASTITLRSHKPPSEEEILFWQKNYFKNKILLITRKDNYWKSEIADIFFANPVEPKKNFYFAHYSIEPYPTDYRKQDLVFVSQRGAKVLVERVDSRLVVEIQNSKPERLSLSLPPYSKETFPIVELIRLSIAQDEFSSDNEILLPIIWQGPITIAGKNLPKSIIALSHMPDFPFYSIGPSNLVMNLTIQTCTNPKMGFLEKKEEIFQKIPIPQSCPLNKGDVLLRFMDGRAAISYMDGWIFLAFNPDQVNQELLLHPEYSFLLWKTIYTSLSSSLIENRDLTEIRPKVVMGKNVFHTPAVFKAKDKIFVYNYNPDSTQVTGIEIPEKKIYHPQKNYLSLRFLALALTLLTIIYLNPIDFFKKFDSQ